MDEARSRAAARPIHPLHAFLLAASVPLFAGALLSDLSYSSTYEVQWTNFASWLLAGALFFAALALLWAFIDLVRGERSRRGVPMIYFLILLGTWVIGLIDALIHAKDAWAKMPDALILSVVVTVLALVAAWLGFSTWRRGDRR